MKSWINISADSDFSLYNIPFGVFQSQNHTPRGATAIGDQVVDLSYLQDKGYLNGLDLPDGIFAKKTLNDFIGLGRAQCGKVRLRLIELLQAGSSLADSPEDHNYVVSQDEQRISGE